MKKVVWYFFASLATIAAAIALYLLYAPKPDLPAQKARDLTVNVGGRERTYVVVAPKEARPHPSVVFVFHPSQGSAIETRRIVGHELERLAQESNAIVVYPNGFEGHFNDCRRVASYSARTLNIDDVLFTESILRGLETEFAIRSDKVFAIGYSNGGHMALRLGLQRPDLIKGIGMVAANFPAGENMGCSVSDSPVSKVVLIEGTKDPINPYSGGNVTLFGFGNRGAVLSAADSAKWFVDTLRLKETGIQSYIDANGMKATQTSWGSETGFVRLVTIEGGGHTIPQSAYRFPRLFGATFKSDRVLADIWQIFFGERP